MPYPISFIANDAGLGNSWFYARLHRPIDDLWYHYAGPSAGDFAASATPLTDTNIRIPLLEIGQKEYGRTLADLATYRLHAYAHDDMAFGDPIRADWYVNLVDGSDVGSGTDDIDLDGPPYVFEAGRIHASGVMRGLRLSQAAEIEGTIHAGSAPAMLARAVNAGGVAIDASSILSVSYSIFELSEADPSVEIPVDGHQSVVLSPASVFFAELQTDYQWGDTDATGYNFRLIPDVAALGPAFATARRHYRVKVDIVPVTGQAFQVRFRPWAV